MLLPKKTNLSQTNSQSGPASTLRDQDKTVSFRNQDKPVSPLRNQGGQIIIVFLLILVIGLAVVLSIASRTVSDIRQTTTSDESNRAYFAAEAGVEKALKQITETPGFVTASQPIDFNAVNKSQTSVTVTNLYDAVAGGADANKIFEVAGKVSKDDSVQIYLMSNYNDISTAGTAGVNGVGFLNSDTLRIYWDEPTSASPGPALEMSILSCTNRTNSALACDNSNINGNNDFNIAKMTFDPDSSRNSSKGTNFCTDPTLVSTGSFAKTTNLNSNVAFKYQAVVRMNNNTLCPRNNIVYGRPVLARIKLLYSPGRMAIESDSGNNGRIIPNQGSKIISIGKLDSGVTRKLTVTKLYPALPTVFDYSLFSGSSSNLTK